MTVDELKEALLNKRPVVLKLPGEKGIECLCVSAIIYRCVKEGKIRITAEVTDKCSHSVMIANPRHIKYLEESEKDK